MFKKTLYHEIGHHVQFISKSKLGSDEAFADTYKAKISKRMIRQRYWYLRPLVLPGRMFFWFIEKVGIVKYIEKRAGGKTE